MVDPKFPMKVPGGPPSDACLSGSSWRCSKTGLNLSMSLNEWYIIIWYTALQITHMILQCDIQIATLRKKPGLVAVGLRSRPLPGENSAKDQPSSAVKGKTYNWNLKNPASRITKKHPKQPPAPWPYLRYRAWAANATIGSSLGLGFRFCLWFFVLQRIWRIRWNWISLIYNFIQCFSSNPTTSTALGMKWSRSSSSH